MSHKKLQVANQNWFLWTSNDFEVYMYGHQRLSTVLSSQKCTTHASTKWFEVDIWGLEWRRHKKFSSPKPKFALRVCINCKMPPKIYIKCIKNSLVRFYQRTPMVFQRNVQSGSEGLLPSKEVPQFHWEQPALLKNTVYIVLKPDIWGLSCFT